MKLIFLILTALLVSGCTGNIRLVDPDIGMIRGTGHITVSWFAENEMRVILEGKAFAGKWMDIDCSANSCQDRSFHQPKLNYHISHGRHTRYGIADLRAAGGAQLHCKFRMHRNDAEGICTKPDGKIFDMKTDKN